MLFFDWSLFVGHFYDFMYGQAAEAIPEWATPSEVPAVCPGENTRVAAAIRARAKAKGKAKAKAKGKAKAMPKAKGKAKAMPKSKASAEGSKSSGRVQGQSLYGKAKQEFKEAFSGPMSGFEKAWKESSRCQQVLREMSWSEIKKRKLDHLWVEEVN